MNTDREEKPRNVIPNWRFFTDTKSLGELESFKVPKFRDSQYPLDEYIEQWNERKSEYNAGDLISAAITNRQTDNDYVREAAAFVLENCRKDNIALQSSANYVIQPHANPIGNSFNLSCAHTKEELRTRIHNLRMILHKFPFNPFVYADLSRAYISLGFKERADKMMKMALYLAPNNRYIVRSAARLYIHLRDLDKAKYVLRKSQGIKYDPWIIASEISVNMLMQKTSAHIKQGQTIVLSNSFTPFSFSELASTLGTLELHYSRKKSRDYFKRSLLNPNDNSLAQAQWVSSKCHIHIPNADNNFGLISDYEAKAYACLEKSNYNDSLQFLRGWMNDMPFSKKPCILGSEICNLYLRDFKQSSDFLEFGKLTHPNDPQILNDLAYAYARNNDVENAEINMRKLETISSHKLSEMLKVCVPATKGLIAFRKKDFERGESLYNKAMAIAQATNISYIYTKLMLNYYREKLILESSATGKEDIITQVNRLEFSNESNREINLLKDEIIDIYKKQQESKKVQ